MSTERDDTTRYLCAAAHLDERFADRAIREFLTEPTRGCPPVAGVRAGAVLAEAVAARARRKLRDTLLLVLFACAVATLPLSVVISWLLIGATVFVVAGPAAGATGDRARRWLPAVGGGLIAGALLVVLVLTDVPATNHLTPAALQLALLLTVLLVDEYVVWHHVQDRFLRTDLPDPAPADLSPQVRHVYYFGARPFLSQLRRLLHRPPEDTGDGVPVVVARGLRVFVGAGEPYRPWSLAVSLRRRADVARVRPMCAAGLYERVERSMSSPRDTDCLSPGGRFAELRVTEQVVVAAEELAGGDELAEDLLAGHPYVPYPLLRGQRVRELRDTPLERARYDLRLRIEAWDRELVVSAFLHLAVSDTTLRVEWTPCVLLPVKARYRAIDSMPDSPLLPVRRAVVRFLTLPLGLPGRLRGACSVIRAGTGAPVPERYGVAHTLRELAADTAMRNYFQVADRTRYLEVLESRLTRTLVEALDEAGYEVGVLEQQVAAVVNTNVHLGGPVPVTGGRRPPVTGAAS